MFCKLRFSLLFFIAFSFCPAAFSQFPFTETFKNSTADHLTFDSLSTDKEANSAFLTAGSIDAEGNGYLRLTSNGFGEVGFVYSKKKFPSSKGFSVDFEYFTYGGGLDKADGICFFLFDANANPFNIGAFGGALGYAQRVYDGKIIPGVSKGYLGVGLDEWGNFPNSNEGKQGGVAWRVPNSVALRGAGHGPDETPDNYPLLTTVETTKLPVPFEVAGGQRNAVSSAVNGYRKAIIELAPRTGGGYLITVKIQLTEGGVTNTKTVIDKFPYTKEAPPYLRFGFAASTGGGNNYHEIRNINFNLPADQVIVPPTANSDSFTINQGDLSGLIIKEMLKNDICNNTGSALDTTSIDLDPSVPGFQNTYLMPGKGTFSVSGGKVNFIPTDGTVSGTFAIKYRVSDNFGGDPSNTAEISVTVVPKPLAENDAVTAVEDTPITFDVIGNDTGTNGSTLDPASVDLDPSTPGRQTEKEIHGKGKFKANDDGTISFTPEPNFNGTIDPINYTITDDNGTVSNAATIAVTITPVNDAPVAADDTKAVDEDTPVTFDIIANDTDVDGNNTIDPASIDLDPASPTKQAEKIISGQGKFTANNDGTITFTPEPNFNGPIDPVNYSIKDNEGLSSSPAVISITVNPVNDPPAAADDEASVPENTPLTFNVIDNDTDADGNNTIDKNSIDLDPALPGQQKQKTIPGQGTLAANNDGTVTFTPEAGFSGPADPVSYTIKDIDGAESAPAAIKITVLSAEPPKIGLAKKLESVNRADNNSYEVSFLFTLKNFGNDELEKISLKDDLAAAFPGTEISISSLIPSGNLKVNSLYDGIQDIELLLPESRIAAGETAEVKLKINVIVTTQGSIFKNSALAAAYSPLTGQFITDKSADGTKPDPQTAGDVSPNSETEIILDNPEIFIPTGFSPNKDGVNDKLVIDNPLSKRISLEIFNRWGNRVYKNPDYKNDWEGVCSEGIRLGEEIPDGTYFYIVIIENGSKQVGQLTVKR